jgi:hypothetical protein
MLQGLDKHSRTALLLDRFHNVIRRESERGGRKVTAFIQGILSRDSYNGNPVMITSTLPIRSPLVPDNMTDLVGGYRMLPLDKEVYITNIIRYWYRLKSDRKEVEERPIDSKLLEIINGHPLAAKMATGFINSEQDQNFYGQFADHDEFRRLLVGVILKNITLNPSEEACVKFLAAFRGDVPIAAIRAWGGEDGVGTLDLLDDRFMIMTDGFVVGMHPAIRHHYRSRLARDEAIPIHRIAFEYYKSQIVKQAEVGKLDVSDVSEACYHAGAVGELAAVASLQYRYVEELKRGAKGIYVLKDYELALMWYEALNDMQPNDPEILAYCARCCHRIAKNLYRRKENLEDYDIDGIMDVSQQENTSFSDDERSEQAELYRFKAEAFFDQALGIVAGTPNEWVLLRDYAHMLVATYNPKRNPEKYSRAEALFNRVEDEFGKSDDAATVAGIGYMRLREGDLVLAEDRFRFVLENIEWDSRFCLYFMCKLTWDQKRFQEFDAYLDRLRLYHFEDDMTNQILSLSGRV